MKSETFESDFVFEKPMLEEAKQLQGEIGKMMEKVQRFNRRLMVKSI